MDKYALLKQNPKRCRQLFGLEFEFLVTLLEKAQKHFEQKKQDNPISNRGWLRY